MAVEKIEPLPEVNGIFDEILPVLHAAATKTVGIINSMIYDDFLFKLRLERFEAAS